MNLNKITQRTWPKLRYLNSLFTNSCRKYPENHFSWSPLGSILKRIPIAIFREILPKYKHWCKKHGLLFCTVDIAKVISASTRKAWEKRTFQGQVFLTYFARRRNRYNSQNMGRASSDSRVKLRRNANITELCVS